MARLSKPNKTRKDRKTGEHIGLSIMIAPLPHNAIPLNPEIISGVMSHVTASANLSARGVRVSENEIRMVLSDDRDEACVRVYCFVPQRDPNSKTRRGRPASPRIISHMMMSDGIIITKIRVLPAIMFESKASFAAKMVAMDKMYKAKPAHQEVFNTKKNRVES